MHSLSQAIVECKDEKTRDGRYKDDRQLEEKKYYCFPSCISGRKK